MKMTFLPPNKSICPDHSLLLFQFVVLFLYQASLHFQGLFFLIPFVLDIPETLLDGWKVHCHLPEVAYTYASMVHRQSHCRSVFIVISFGGRGKVSWHSWVAGGKVSQKNILSPHSTFIHQLDEMVEVIAFPTVSPHQWLD